MVTLASTQKAKMGRSLCIQEGQPRLHREFQDSQGHTERPCLKAKQKPPQYHLSRLPVQGLSYGFERYWQGHGIECPVLSTGDLSSWGVVLIHYHIL